MAIKDEKLERMKERARQLGGECLANEYTGRHDKVDFVCAKGHHFKKHYQGLIHQGRWCVDCYNERTRVTFEECVERGRSVGYELLSDRSEWVDTRTVLRWRCHKHNSEFMTASEDINRHVGCVKCRKKPGIFREQIDRIVDYRGGELVSLFDGKLPDSRDSLTFKCSNGHVFTSTAHCIVYKGSWCPTCKNTWIGEEACRKYIDRWCDAKFVKVRPEFLRIGKRSVLELDGYNEDLGLAFEHHGAQHYEFTSHFYDHEDEFKKRVEYDEIKRVSCASNKIFLLEINGGKGKKFDRWKLENIVANTAKEKCLPFAINPEFCQMMDEYVLGIWKPHNM